ncbi:MAG: nicotinate-nucleotide--dimethylbenzimidazole phosphoribosyltransferase [Victivallaceae bacterium]|nr:nicotinate-nucleotide--dimethylbenzimidazole phosphoribosyltransferase [Victivallaceae bacterium]
MIMKLNDAITAIEPADQEFRQAATEHIRNLTMPPWALGELLDLAVDLAGMTRNLKFPTARKKIILMAGDHGIVCEGVCPQPSSVTTQMLYNFVNGGAGVNVLARQVGATVTIVDVGVDADLSELVRDGKIIDRKIRRGTANFAVGPAMSRAEALQAIEAGIEVATTLAPETDIFGTGEMGIGNTSPSSAIVAVMARAGNDVRPFTGLGAGLAPEKLLHKATVIQRGIDLNSPDPDDALDVLAKVGGFEIGGLAGVMLGAAAHRRPILVDGFISGAAALIARALAPSVSDYLIAAHVGAESGHEAVIKMLNKKPLLNLGLRLGEGTGAALAMHLVDAAALIVNEMATFESAGVKVC